jgi:hypothetical protein
VWRGGERRRAIYSRENGVILTGAEHAKLVLPASMAVRPAEVKRCQRWDASGSGAVDVTRREVTRWPASWLAQGERRLVAVLELGGDGTCRRD